MRHYGEMNEWISNEYIYIYIYIYIYPHAIEKYTRKRNFKNHADNRTFAAQNIDGSLQDSSISIISALAILLSCTKSSIWYTMVFGCHNSQCLRNWHLIPCTLLWGMGYILKVQSLAHIWGFVVLYSVLLDYVLSIVGDIRSKCI